MTSTLDNLHVKIYADGADKKSLLELSKNPYIKGFTTNPTLMRKAGITDYKAFALDVLSEIKDRPISFEVFSDDFNEMNDQALEIASWASNVYVKIPITNTKGHMSTRLVSSLTNSGVKVNVTAIFTHDQVYATTKALEGGAPSVISIFAGRIADTAIDAKQFMANAVATCEVIDPNIEILWASPRELYNIVEANDVGCDIITVSHDILNKLHLFDKDLYEYSLETVKMFFDDAQKSGFKI